MCSIFTWNCELYGFQIDMAYKSIDSHLWGMRISPFLTEIHIAKVIMCMLLKFIWNSFWK